MVDVFGEVDEQLRSERLRKFLQTAVPAFIGALIIVLVGVIGVWGVDQYKASQAAKQSQAYSDALDTAAKGDVAKAFDQFGAIAKGSSTYASLSLMQQAGIRMDQNKPAEAAQLFDKAAQATKSQMIADVASLKAAYALLDTAPLDQMVSRLTPLTKPERPYHIQALEALALANLGAGKTADAKATLVQLSNLLDTPDSARQRAQATIALIDSGTAGSIKSLAQQALTATPTPLAPPAQAGGPPQPPAQAQGQPEAPQ